MPGQVPRGDEYYFIYQLQGKRSEGAYTRDTENLRHRFGFGGGGWSLWNALDSFNSYIIYRRLKTAALVFYGGFEIPVGAPEWVGRCFPQAAFSSQKEPNPLFPIYLPGAEKHYPWQFSPRGRAQAPPQDYPEARALRAELFPEARAGFLPPISGEVCTRLEEFITAWEKTDFRCPLCQSFVEYGPLPTTAIMVAYRCNCRIGSKGHRRVERVLVDKYKKLTQEDWDRIIEAI